MFSISIDGTSYNVEVDAIGLQGDFLYKYAERLQSGDFQSEAIGFFENQTITFRGDNNSDFVDLYEALTTINADGTYSRDITVYSPLGEYVGTMYPDKMYVDLTHIDKNDNKWWGEMTVKFTSISKVGR